MGWLRAAFTKEVHLSDIGQKLRRKSWKAIDTRAHVEYLRKVYVDRSTSVFGKIRNHLYLGTSDVANITNISTAQLKVMERVQEVLERYDALEETFILKLRKINREQRHFLESVLARHLNDIREAESQARASAQMAGLHRAGRTALFAGFVPIGTIGAVLSSGAALTSALIRSLDDFFDTTRVGVSALYAKAGTAAAVDPNVASALNKDLAALRAEWQEIRKDFGKEATKLKQHGERVKNWFKAFMNFTLKLQAVYIGTKRLAFTAEEARKWKELEEREAAQILAILQEHLNVVEIAGGLTVPTSRKFSPNGVVKRIARVLTAKEELAA